MPRLRNVLRGTRVRLERDLERELADHIARRMADLVSAGMSETAAQRQARLELGGVAQVQEEVRETWVPRWLDHVVRDVRYAARSLRKSWAFAAGAAAVLALGTGAVTTIFSVVHGVLLTPLPYADSGRLYAVAEFAAAFAEQYPQLPVNAAHFASWRTRCTSCETGALVRPAAFALTGDHEPERIDGAESTWQLFQVLGVSPQLGRTFVEADDMPGNNRQVVITDGLWRRRFAADPGVIGRPIQLSGTAHVVVGVLPPGFRFPTGRQLSTVVTLSDRAEIFRPLGLNWAGQDDIGRFNFAAVMRLRPGASPVRAEEEMTAAVAEVGLKMKTELRALLTPLHERVTGGSRDALWLLFGAVGALLLIVCVNLGHLMLVRAARRSRDAAIRLALGARSSAIFRETMAESLVIAAAGGVGGALVSFAGVRAVVAAAPADLPRLDEVGVNTTVFAFALGVSVVCGVLCGLWPAVRLTRTRSTEALAAMSRRTTDGRGARRLREWLVGAEVALSTVLLVIAGLLGVSFLGVLNVDRGFDAERVLTADISLPVSRYETNDQRDGFHRRMLESLNALPGVTSAALVGSLPLKAQIWGDIITKEGDTRPEVERPLASFRFISPRYFEAMGIDVRAGRGVTERDRVRPVAVMSESAAARTWPGEEAVGKRIRAGDGKNAPTIEVVGVVADVRTVSLEATPPPIVYVPYWDGGLWQGSVWGNATYVLRSAREPATLAGPFRHAVRELDAELPLADVRTMRDVISASVAGRRFYTLVASVFAVSALFLACLGVYGAIAYTVACRANEMGLRMALGAQPSNVVGLVLRQGLLPIAGGLAVGVAAALWAGHLLSGLVFGVNPRDPATLAAVAVALATAAAAACWLPAHRASLIDPSRTLRQD